VYAISVQKIVYNKEDFIMKNQYANRFSDFFSDYVISLTLYVKDMIMNISKKKYSLIFVLSVLSAVLFNSVDARQVFLLAPSEGAKIMVDRNVAVSQSMLLRNMLEEDQGDGMIPVIPVLQETFDVATLECFVGLMEVASQDRRNAKVMCLLANQIRQMNLTLPELSLLFDVTTYFGSDDILDAFAILLGLEAIEIKDGKVEVRNILNVSPDQFRDVFKPLFVKCFQKVTEQFAKLKKSALQFRNRPYESCFSVGYRLADQIEQMNLTLPELSLLSKVITYFEDENLEKSDVFKALVRVFSQRGFSVKAKGKVFACRPIG